MELSEATKQTIRAEEIFRLEVQKELTAGRGQSKYSQLWKVINSSIVIWLLSSIVVTSASWLFTYFQQQNKDRAERVSTVHALILEIDIRCSSSQEHLINLLVSETPKKEVALQLMKNWLKAPIDSMERNGHVEPVFEEYRQTSLLSLVYQLKRFSQSEDATQILDEFIDFATSVGATTSSTPDFSEKSDDDVIKNYVDSVVALRQSLLPSSFGSE